MYTQLVPFEYPSSPVADYPVESVKFKLSFSRLNVWFIHNPPEIHIAQPLVVDYLESLKPFIRANPYRFQCKYVCIKQVYNVDDPQEIWSKFIQIYIRCPKPGHYEVISNDYFWINSTGPTKDDFSLPRFYYPPLIAHRRANRAVRRYCRKLRPSGVQYQTLEEAFEPVRYRDVGRRLIIAYEDFTV